MWHRMRQLRWHHHIHRLKRKRGGAHEQAFKRWKIKKDKHVIAAVTPSNIPVYKTLPESEAGISTEMCKILLPYSYKPKLYLDRVDTAEDMNTTLAQPYNQAHIHNLHYFGVFSAEYGLQNHRLLVSTAENYTKIHRQLKKNLIMN